MMKPIKTTLLSLLLLSTAGLSSCDFNDAKFSNITPTYALPIVDDSLTTVDMVKRRKDDGSLRTESDSSYFFLFSSIVNSPKAEEIISLNDVDRTFTVNFPNTNTLTTTATINVDLPLVNGELREFIAKNGTMGFSLIGDASNFQRYSLNFNGGLVDNSNNVNQIINSQVMNSLFEVPMGGLRFNLQANNTINISLTYTKRNATAPVPPLSFRINTQGLEFSYIRGNLDFGSLLGGVAEPIRIKLFDKQFREDADVFFANPSLTLDFRNSFGAEVAASIISFLGLVEPNSAPYPLTGAGIRDLQNFPVPAGQFANRSITRSGLASFTLDRNNSSLIDFLRSAPRFVNITPGGEIDGTQTDVQAMDSSRFSIQASVKLPVFGFVNRYSLADTFDIEDLPENTSSSSVLSAQLKLVFYNQFPVNVNGNIYFINASNQIVDSLVVRENGTLNRVLATGAVAGPAPSFRVPLSNVVRNERIFNVSKERYENIQKNVRKGVFVATLSSNGANNQQLHRIYTDYFVRFKLGAQIATDINLNN